MPKARQALGEPGDLDVDRAGPGHRARSSGVRREAPTGGPSGILRLQQLAGNAATTGLLRRGAGPPSVQRRTAVKSGLTAGLAGPEPKKRRIVGQKDAGGELPADVFSLGKVGDYPDKKGALEAIAEKAGEIGNRVHDWGKPGGTAGIVEGVGKTGTKRWEPQKMFTRLEAELNKDEVATLDPFMLRASAAYGPETGRQTLDLVYQHAAAFQGYVETVHDTGNTEASPPATMFHGSDKENPFGNRRPVYGDLHEKTGSTNLLGLTGGPTRQGLDAYTKLAGEGARWECVRKHMDKLANDSIFYCVDPANKDSNVRGLRFDELWVSWASHFEKRYNIPNAKVISLLQAKRLGKDYAKGDVADARHINLGVM